MDYTPTITKLWLADPKIYALIRRIANSHPIYTYGGVNECRYCEKVWAIGDDPSTHETDCVYCAAKELILVIDKVDAL